VRNKIVENEEEREREREWKKENLESGVFGVEFFVESFHSLGN